MRFLQHVGRQVPGPRLKQGSHGAGNRAGMRHADQVSESHWAQGPRRFHGRQHASVSLLLFVSCFVSAGTGEPAGSAELQIETLEPGTSDRSPTCAQCQDQLRELCVHQGSA